MGWIPCDKELPLRDGRYLVSCIGTLGTYVDILDFKTDVSNEYETDKRSAWIYEEFDTIIENVVAWQELPLPYEEKNELQKIFVAVLQEMEQEDYDCYCHNGFSHLDEGEWKWLIQNIEDEETWKRLMECVEDDKG